MDSAPSFPNLKKSVNSSLARAINALTFPLTLTERLLAEVTNLLKIISGCLVFVSRSDDIFIVTYPRSGTTWLQMILYQLTTDGTMDFTHISERIPFFERSLLLGRDLNQLSSPRIFKTHLRTIFRYLTRRQKYIYVVRDGRDVAVSCFHFYGTTLGFKGSFDKFFDLFLQGKMQYGSWFKHVGTWQKRACADNVLLLTYERLIEDLEGALNQIAAFCGYEIEKERYSAILERCNFAFMKQHESKFEHITEVLWERGLMQGEFFRQGRVGSWKIEFTKEQESRFDDIAAQTLLNKHGVNFATDPQRARAEAGPKVD